jgi:hypothetical protein
MKKLIAIVAALACVFAINVYGAKDRGNANARKPAQKPKNVAPKQQQQRTAPKTNAKANVENKTSKKLNASEKTKLQTNTNTDAIRNNVNVNKNNINVNKVTVNRESVARIQAQNVNFRAVPNTAINTVRFNPAYRIAAATNWVGPRYDVFRTYQPEWHDRGWWGSHYARMSLIAGGWYYFNNGYWAPAWGYDESAAYYPYDGPIYAGPSGRPPDQVVADVQGILKEQGYYKGEIDGLVGPMTREALTAYQEAAGLPPTASVDEPTLESLGLS